MLEEVEGLPGPHMSTPRPCCSRDVALSALSVLTLRIDTLLRNGGLRFVLLALGLLLLLKPSLGMMDPDRDLDGAGQYMSGT